MKYLAEVFDQLGIVAWKDKEGHFLGMNQMGLDVLGVKIGDVVGKKDEDFFPMDLVEGYRKDDKEVMKTGKKKILQRKSYGQGWKLHRNACNKNSFARSKWKYRGCNYSCDTRIIEGIL